MPGDNLRRSALAATDGASAYVNNGSTVSFISGVPKQSQQDVLDSVLLAQLAASYEFDREKATEQWYRKYVEVLENLGWIIESFAFERGKSSGTTVRLDKTALKIIAAVASDNELDVLTTALEALEGSDPNSKQSTIFDTNGSVGEAGNFQLGSASLDHTGNVQMALGAFYFKATEHKTRFLFFTWKTTDINVYVGAQKVLLNEKIYAEIREAVIKKLGGQQEKYIDSLF